MRGSRYIGYLLGSALAAAVPAHAQPMKEAPVLAAPESQTVEPLPPSPTSDPDRYSEIIAPPPAETVEGLIASRLAESKQDADLGAFYAARNHAPLWVTDGKLNAKALAVMTRIARADEDGLDAAAFILPDAAATDDSPEQLAAAEIALSRAVTAFARQAEGGRLEPSSLSPLITPEPQRPSREDVLNLMAAREDAADWLDTYNPPHPQFLALKKQLADARKKASEPQPAPPPEIPAGKSLKPGMTDDRVPLLRVRLGLPEVKDDVTDGQTVTQVDNRHYDDALIAAVKSFQEKHGLNPDGALGPQTLLVMNEAAKVEDPTDLILVNMERWRWLPRQLGETHIFVNVPEFKARIVRDGAVVHETRVITGTRQNQTPIFSDEMDHIIVNPAWNVPYSIASKEMLPNLLRDPTYLARQGIEVLYTGDRKPVVIDSTMVDWSRVDMRKIRFRQPPGERNALGNIKFMFPNKHAVYLHDTPTRNLFAKDMRAFSHGCVRVQDPFALADVLLEGTEFDTARLKKMLGGSAERRINLAHKIPIHITYFTAEVAEDGSLLTRPDVYGTDKKMMAALGLGGQAQASAKP